MEGACAGKAYSVSISKDCALCFARAAREVFNSKNASVGYFCSACAARAVQGSPDNRSASKSWLPARLNSDLRLMRWTFDWGQWLKHPDSRPILSLQPVDREPLQNPP